MVQALETQLDSGPLADLTAGTVNGNGFVSEAESLESSYESYADSELLPRFPNVDEMIKLQGQAVVSDLVALNQANSVGLTTTANGSRPGQRGDRHADQRPGLRVEHPAVRFHDRDADVRQRVERRRGEPQLDVDAVAHAGPGQHDGRGRGRGVSATIHAGLQVSHSNISSAVDTAVDNLESAAQGIASATSQASAPIATDDGDRRVRRRGHWHVGRIRRGWAVREDRRQVGTVGRDAQSRVDDPVRRRHRAGRRPGGSHGHAHLDVHRPWH